MKRASLFSLLILLAPVLLEAQEVNVLMLGNSYTTGISHYVRSMLKHEAPEYSVTIVAPGGKDVRYHLTSDVTHEKLRTEKWDILVIQGQSLESALSPEYSKRFQDSVAGLVKLARDHGVTRVVLYQTWGRRDGHRKLREVYPDFQIMHKKVSEQYRRAAKRNRVELAPVGEAFARLHATDRELFRSLYTNDGSHPKPIGGYLAACVFTCLFTGKQATDINWSGKIDPRTVQTLRSVADAAFVERSK